MHELVDQLLSHLKATWRYRWYAVVFAWIIALGGWIAVYLMPNRYEASARVHVDTQSVLRPLLAGLTVQPNVDQMVTMMSQTVISRPNLEKVIRMADMDVGLKTPEDREQLITRLTKELAIKSAGRENLYTIAYSDKNPEEAKRVVQSLLTLFVEGTLGDQRKDSEAARRFIDEQLKTYSDKLVAAESAVTEFRRQHMGLMAGDRRDYYTRLVEAQAALSRATLELKEAQDSRDAIKKQLAGAAEDIPSLLGADEGVHLEIDSRIQALEQKLDALRLNYTERHPDIVAIVRSIDQLKEQKKAEAKLRKPAPGAAQVQNPIYQQLTISLERNGLPGDRSAPGAVRTQSAQPPAADVPCPAGGARGWARCCFSDQPDQAHVQRRAQAAGGERAAGARDGRHGLDRCTESAPDPGTGRAPDFIR